MAFHLAYIAARPCRPHARTSIAGVESLYPTPAIDPAWIDLNRIFEPTLVGALVLDLLLIIRLVLRG